ncbi:MAG TPA: hypothetical protein ENJ95_14975 [Bacteroidetes bacterium]|nr:hypothetical protein [Bacteroidota bacterium]
MRQFKSPIKLANKSDVQFAATHLIKTHGATTTLEVKNRLRSNGFIAFQNDVSIFMKIIAAEQGWEQECNGRFRIYSFSDDYYFSKNANIAAFSLN